MTQKFRIFRSTVALPALAIGLIAAQSAQADGHLDSLDLNVVGSWSTSNIYPDYEVPFWTERLPEASGGQINATIQAFDEVGLAGGDVYELVEQGVYDVGATVIGYVAGEDPRFEGHDLPAVADPEQSRAIVDAYRDVLAEAFDETYDQQLLGVIPFTSQIVYCNTAIEGLEDMEGLRIRGSGRFTMDFIEAIGGDAQDVSFDEVPVALERGVIDCGITGALSGFLAGWTEVSTHYYPLPAGGWDHVGITMRNDIWEGLSEDTQEFLMEQFAELEDWVWGDAPGQTDVGIACNTGGDCAYGDPGDLTLVEVDDDDLAFAVDMVEAEVLPQWFERCGEECEARWLDTVGAVYGQ